MRNRVKLFFWGGGGGGGRSETFSWVQQRPSARPSIIRGVARIFGGGCRGGGGPRSAKEANNPNKRAAELKPRPCAHQGSMFRP